MLAGHVPMLLFTFIARPLSVIHGIVPAILLIFSDSLDDADEWHRSHSMH
jgi:hypothetical protein